VDTVRVDDRRLRDNRARREIGYGVSRGSLCPAQLCRLRVQSFLGIPSHSVKYCTAPAVTTAAKMPSTNAAETSRVSMPASGTRSTASSALRTAEPRSMITTTPAPSSAATMASATRAASVPSRSSDVPAAISMRGAGPGTISSASSTAAWARRGLWETTTIPTIWLNGEAQWKGRRRAET
jgi:hypothetical protein